MSFTWQTTATGFPALMDARNPFSQYESQPGGLCGCGHIYYWWKTSRHRESSSKALRVRQITRLWWGFCWCGRFFLLVRGFTFLLAPAVPNLKSAPMPRFSRNETGAAVLACRDSHGFGHSVLDEREGACPGQPRDPHPKLKNLKRAAIVMPSTA